MKALMLTEMNVILLAWRSPPPMLMKEPKEGRRRKELERLLWKVPLKPSPALAT